MAGLTEKSKKEDIWNRLKEAVGLVSAQEREQQKAEKAAAAAKTARLEAIKARVREMAAGDGDVAQVIMSASHEEFEQVDDFLDLFADDVPLPRALVRLHDGTKALLGRELRGDGDTPADDAERIAAAVEDPAEGKT